VSATPARIVRAADAAGVERIASLARGAGEGAVLVRAQTIEALADREALLTEARRQGFAEGLRAAALRGAGCLADAEIPVGPGLLGRVVGADGLPIDGGPALDGGCVRRPLDAPAPPPLGRRPIDEVLVTGVRALDAACTLGIGQRVAVAGPAGLGARALLGALARQVPATACVFGLIGAGGGAARALVDELRAAGGLGRCVVVVSGADEAPEVRVRAALAATTIAAHLRDEVAGAAGEAAHVLLLVDSLTSVAQALGGQALAAIVERAGNGARGRMTAVYAVREPGGAGEGARGAEQTSEDLVFRELLGVFDGYLRLSRAARSAGREPALDVLASYSRGAESLVTPEHRADAKRLRALLARLEAHRAAPAVGYRRGLDLELDAALLAAPELDDLLCQPFEAATPFAETVRRLARAVR
jgi:flagellar biosynthesis/type III secretory pathway ATPase